MLPLVTFWALVLLSARDASWRTALRQKPAEDWLIDLVGLTIQGGLVPLLAVSVLREGWQHLWPSAAGALVLPPLVAFLFNFVVVDYAYYWNHRLLHGERLWPIHAVHHTVSSMDTLGTARNTLWSSFAIVYVWAHGLMVFLLSDPAPYLASAALTAALDLWRHSAVDPPAWLAARLDPWLVLPRDHARHHATRGFGNYGANLKLWDRLHGTTASAPAAPAGLGSPLPLSLGRRILWPFRSTAR